MKSFQLTLPGTPSADYPVPHIGVDEAGRGCLAGPVCAAAILAPAGFDFTAAFSGLADSKILSAKQRAALEKSLKTSGLAWGLGLAWPREIDAVNILNATFRAMSRAVLSLQASLVRRSNPLACPLLIDGPHRIPEKEWSAAGGSGRPAVLPPQKAVVDGDALIASISAASILAKTHRDRLMSALGRRYPQYAFAGHKGYGTREHLSLLAEHGPSPLHRLSFRHCAR